MLRNSVKSFMATIALVAGATFAVPASAEWPGNSSGYIGGSHGGIYIGGGHRGIHIGDGYVKRHKSHSRHGIKKQRKFNSHRADRVRHHGHCGPRRALRKAWNLGLNRPHIARLNKKRIVVVGYNRGHTAKVVFKRKSHRCRVIKTRGLY